MYCQACGTKNAPDARFCNMCGSRIASPGTPGGPVEPTRLGLGAVPSAGSAKDAPPSAEPLHAPPPGTPMGPPPGGGNTLSGVSLDAIGIRSTKKTWTVLALAGLLLLAAGALLTFFTMRATRTPAEAGNARPDDPFVVGAPTPDVDYVSGHADGEPAGAAPSVPPAPSGGAGGAPPAGGTDASRGTTESTGATGASPSGHGGASSGATAAATSGHATTGGTGSSTHASGGATSTAGGDTGTTDTSAGNGGDTAGETGGTTTSTGSTGGDTTTVPDEAGGQDRDLEMEMYAARVRYLVRRYYMARAQSCFDRATRNNPSLSGQVIVNMHIAADGSVSSGTVLRNSTGDDALGACLAAQVQSWRLSPPPGGEVDMHMPFSR